MTQRERHASPGLSATAPADPPAPTCPTPVPELSRAGQDVAPPPRASFWEDVFQSASPAQRQELLSLASRQGLLYAHQLPRLPNGSGSGGPHRHAVADDLRGLNLVSRLLQGHL